jgi:hypothetical protein
MPARDVHCVFAWWSLMAGHGPCRMYEAGVSPGCTRAVITTVRFGCCGLVSDVIVSRSAAHVRLVSYRGARSCTLWC